MGISSNQARLMTLTARQHDLELRAQQISAQKMIKGLESQEAAMEYSRALNNYAVFKQIEALPRNGNDGYGVTVNNGYISYREILPGEDRDDDFDTWGWAGDDILWEIDGMSAFGRPILLYEDANGDDYIDLDRFLQTEKAKYESFTASISAEEKLLDMELTQINTEHSAVKTEYDSVKGLVGENVDKSFNVFS